MFLMLFSDGASRSRRRTASRRFMGRLLESGSFPHDARGMGGRVATRFDPTWIQFLGRSRHGVFPCQSSTKRPILVAPAVHALMRAAILVPWEFSCEISERNGSSSSSPIHSVNRPWIYLPLSDRVVATRSHIRLDRVILIGTGSLSQPIRSLRHRSPTETVGVPADWPHRFEGFEAHWNKNTNAASAFDKWFLNEFFPRKKPFTFNPAAMQPSVSFPLSRHHVCMDYSPVNGCVIHSRHASESCVSRPPLSFAFSLAYGLDALGVCPIVKRIWTPTWVLWSGGWFFAFLLFFHGICDHLGATRWHSP